MPFNLLFAGKRKEPPKLVKQIRPINYTVEPNMTIKPHLYSMDLSVDTLNSVNESLSQLCYLINKGHL